MPLTVTPGNERPNIDPTFTEASPAQLVEVSRKFDFNCMCLLYCNYWQCTFPHIWNKIIFFLIQNLRAFSVSIKKKKREREKDKQGNKTLFHTNSIVSKKTYLYFVLKKECLGQFSQKLIKYYRIYFLKKVLEKTKFTSSL